MALNYLFIGFFFIAFVICCFKALLGDLEIFGRVMESSFDMAKTGFELSIGLTGVMTLWLGLMRVGEKGGVVGQLSKFIHPLFKRLLPDVPKDHPATGAMMMNFAANMLGLDNAATPLGLKAMKDLQDLNPNKETASNAQIMFLVLNTSGLTVIPISIMMYRAQLGSDTPTDVFLPILLATFCSTVAGLLVTSLVQKLHLWRYWEVWAYLGGASILVTTLVYSIYQLNSGESGVYASLIGNFILFGFIIWFITAGLIKKINVYEHFIEGAKEGFSVAIKIIPYLVGILVAIGVFRAAGGIDMLSDGTRYIVEMMGIRSEWVDALPTAYMKPLSGGGARAMMLETINNEIALAGDKVAGTNSLVSRMVSTLQGSTETTFYVLAVYFGSVGIKNTRHAVGCGLFADLVGIIAAILFTYLFFGN